MIAGLFAAWGRISVGAAVSAIVVSGCFFAACKNVFAVIPKFAKADAAQARLTKWMQAPDDGRHPVQEAGIEQLLDKKAGFENTGFSGGEMQKIALARILLKDAPLLLLDEPDHYLDEASRLQLYQKLSESEKTAVCISHEASFVEFFTKSSIVFNQS